MTTWREHGSRFASPWGAIVLALALAHCSADKTPVSDGQAALVAAADPWTSRDIWTLRNVRWSSHRNLNSDALKQTADARASEGMIPINIGAAVDSGDLEFSVVFRENVDGRDWRADWNLTAAEYDALVEQYKNEGLRPLNVTGYQLSNGLRYAGIWIENREGLGWSAWRALTNDTYGAKFEELRGRGLRPIDIDGHDTDNGLQYATIWYDNVDNVQWAQYRNMSRDRYQSELDQRTANGFLIIDYDEYDGADQHAGIWEQPANRPAFAVRTGRDGSEFANYWRQYRDQGLRPFHVEDHDGDAFAGIWIENDDRFNYERKVDINAAIAGYRASNNLPGISVAVMRGGGILYQAGFGFADEGDDKWAHAETVYAAASVSKIFGGTLAAKLEATGALMDGSPVELDLRRPTADFLPGIPAQHTHTVEQLTAHLGCVGHYETDPPIEDQDDHYDTARAAVESIWGIPLVSGCSIGNNYSYSTGGFTFVGAVLEAVSGRSIHELIRTELTEPFGLRSLRSQWAGRDLPDNFERASPYDSNNWEDSYDDSSWKVLGGGIELNVVDLARFGSMVMRAEIVSPEVRDNRLFTPVSPGCSVGRDALCNNGVAWRLTNNGRFVAEHNGSATGARSLLRLYPNDDLVIAIMSNRKGHDPDIFSLGDSIASIVLD